MVFNEWGGDVEKRFVQRADQTPSRLRNLGRIVDGALLFTTRSLLDKGKSSVYCFRVLNTIGRAMISVLENATS